MKFALLDTTLLVLLLTSTCVASALQANHEDGGGYRDKLVKRYLSESSSENSPPTPPRQGLERGLPDTFAQHIRVESKQSAAVPSRRKRSTSRSPVRPGKGPIGGVIALSDDSIDHLNDEETDDEETESDAWSAKRHEGAWRHNNVPVKKTRGRNDVKNAKESSSETSEKTRKRFKIVPSVYENTSPSPSSSRTPSATYATESPSWKKPAHESFPSHASVTQNDNRNNAFGPREQRTSSSTRFSSATLSIPHAATSAYYDKSGKIRVSSHHSITSPDDEISTGEWRQRQDLQRGQERRRSNGKRQNISFRHYFDAKEPNYKEKVELTPEQFSLLSHAKTRQDFNELGSGILQFPFKLTKDQLKELEDNKEKFDGKFRHELRNLQTNNYLRAKRRHATYQAMQAQGSLDAPKSYQDMGGKELERFRSTVLTRLVNSIRRVQNHGEPLNLVDGQDLRPVDQWTQEDLDWWKGFLDFRKAIRRLTKVEPLIEEIEHFFTKGKGREMRPPNETNKGKKIHFRPVKAYKEADHKGT